ncbi:MAG: hypothetical protein KAG98_00835, partial [Lentisphaeria bacterium]|nr:hypothetical protein [Lentisphaeria bacterium]
MNTIRKIGVRIKYIGMVTFYQNRPAVYLKSWRLVGYDGFNPHEITHFDKNPKVYSGFDHNP